MKYIDKTLKLSKKHFDKKGNYCSSDDLTAFDGNIEIDANLDCIYFDRLSCDGYIISQPNTHLICDNDISTGAGIIFSGSIVCRNMLCGGRLEVGDGIVAHDSIAADGSIQSNDSIVAKNIKSNGSILSKKEITVSGTINCGTVLFCNDSIHAVDIISADSIYSNRYILAENNIFSCGGLTAKDDIFSGVIDVMGSIYSSRIFCDEITSKGTVNSVVLNKNGGDKND